MLCFNESWALFLNTLAIEISVEAITWQSVCCEDTHLKQSWHTSNALIHAQVLLKARKSPGQLGLKGNYTWTALVCTYSNPRLMWRAESKGIRDTIFAYEMVESQRAPLMTEHCISMWRRVVTGKDLHRSLLMNHCGVLTSDHSTSTYVTVMVYRRFWDGSRQTWSCARVSVPSLESSAPIKHHSACYCEMPSEMCITGEELQ